MTDATNRAEVRDYFTKLLEDQRQVQAEQLLPFYARRRFQTADPAWLIEHAERALRWMDCAPDGARWIMAPLQAKDGTPFSDNNSENVGANQALRAARIRHGVHPLSGERSEA